MLITNKIFIYCNSDTLKHIYLYTTLQAARVKGELDVCDITVNGRSKKCDKMWQKGEGG